MQKEKKTEINNDKRADKDQTDTLSDIENEILTNKDLNNPTENKNIKLDLQENQIKKNTFSNKKEKQEENNESNQSNLNSNDITNNNNNKALLSTKRNRPDSSESQFDNSNRNSAYNKQNNNETSIATARGIECPYLGTIRRHLLDFDFEKVCSITLSNLNVYACLVCGKYYQGRGRNTNAYVHSLQEDHHLFINLNDEKIICLPEGYEVIDNSLKDIKLNLKPVFSEAEIAEIDKEKDLNKVYSSALDGTEYIPGCIGLNNIKKTDYVNVIIQALCRVTPLRDYFLKYDDNTTNLVNFIY